MNYGGNKKNSKKREANFDERNDLPIFLCRYKPDSISCLLNGCLKNILADYSLQVS